MAESATQPTREPFAAERCGLPWCVGPGLIVRPRVGPWRLCVVRGVYGPGCCGGQDRPGIEARMFPWRDAETTDAGLQASTNKGHLPL
jgi:hypothetical protein